MMLGLRLSGCLPTGQAARASARACSRWPALCGFVAPARSSLAAQPATHRARLATAASASAGAAAPAAGNATDSLADAYTRLAGVKPYLVSTQQPVELTGLWGADERAVVFFARHMVRRCWCGLGEESWSGDEQGGAVRAPSAPPPRTHQPRRAAPLMAQG